MSQPPQPPNEGFGAPQDPPPGGFGAPQEPGYGYPQTPPPAGQTPPPPAGQPATPPPPAGPPGTPPPGQPGYGYPQAPGQVYPTPAPGQQIGYGQQQPYGAQPQQPYGTQQQPYGTPQQQPYGTYQQYQQPGAAPAGAPGGGGGKKLNAQMMIIIAAVVAVALIIGAGVFLASGDDDGGKKNESKQGETDGGKTGGNEGENKGGDGGKEKKPASTSAKSLFNVPAPEVKNDDSIATDGSWLTEKTYAKSGVNEIVGYEPLTGAKLWTIPLAGPVCAGSEHVTEDGLTAVLFQGAKPTKARAHMGCTEVAAIDLDNGQKLWQKGSKAGDTKMTFDEVTVGKGLVAAGGTSGGSAWEIKSGNVKWEPRAGDKCKDNGYAGGNGLVALSRCGADYDTAALKVQPLDESGKPLSSYTLPPGIQWGSIVSASPLVAAVDSTDQSKGPTDYFVIDEKTGKLRSKISVDPEKYQRTCDATEVAQCRNVAVGNDHLYLATREHEGGGEYGMTNEIISFDLATGKEAGQKADAGDRYTMFPLRMDGGNIIAYKVPPYDKGGQIVSIDGKTFKETVFLENPADEAVRDAESSFSTDYAEYRYSNGRLYISDVFASKPLSADDKNYLVVAFGAS